MTLGRRAAGVVSIVSVVLLWVGSSELIQIIFDSQSFKFESPLFLTFYSTSLFAIYLSGFLFSSRWRRSLSGARAGVRACMRARARACVAAAAAAAAAFLRLRGQSAGRETCPGGPLAQP
jgi:hypothetical protein